MSSYIPVPFDTVNRTRAASVVVVVFLYTARNGETSVLKIIIDDGAHPGSGVAGGSTWTRTRPGRMKTARHERAGWRGRYDDGREGRGVLRSRIPGLWTTRATQRF